MYESFYLRAVSPAAPTSIWIRYTVLKRSGRDPVGALWFTYFDSDLERPVQRKQAGGALSVPPHGWIAVGESSFAPGVAHGSFADVGWNLRIEAGEPELRHLAPGILYDLPLPRTKLTSPTPFARFSGELRIEGRDPISIEGWPGMVGHNWGAEHAERWIWLNATALDGRPEAWLDVALGRLRIAGRMTPWIANGAISIAGRRYTVGGLGRRVNVRETAGGADLELHGAHGLHIAGRITVPSGAASGWRYYDPAGGEHEVMNCSIAGVELNVEGVGDDGPLSLVSACGGVYELGARDLGGAVELLEISED